MAKKMYGPCLVCEDVAIGINFSVPTCMPCKSFFRRNAVKLGVRSFVCLADGDCAISYKFRRSCNCCRLAKCFRVGMKKSLIMSDAEREARNKLVEANRLKRGQMPKQQCAKWMIPTTSLNMSPKQVVCLSPSDQVVLSNIMGAYESTCIAARNARFSSFPSVAHTVIPAFLNECSASFPVFVEYFKHIPEFRNINIQDKVNLVKNHCGMVISVNESLLYPVPSSNLIISWTNIFGVEITRRLLQRQKVMDPYTHDPVVLKILLVVLVLSCNKNRNFGPMDTGDGYTDPLSIFAAQNVYVELLWRYVLSRSATERNAVRFWNKLMMCILCTQNISAQMDEFVSTQIHHMPQTVPIIQNMWPRKDIAPTMNNREMDPSMLLPPHNPLVS